MTITERYQALRDEIPAGVTIVLAAKSRSSEEVAEAIDAGATDLGENYVQEGEAVHATLGAEARRVRWHMIGPLQKNKINKALPIFDVIQTVDSLDTATNIDKRVERAGKSIMPIFLEINIAGEQSKSGIEAGADESIDAGVEQIARALEDLRHVRLEGLMTMGPLTDDPEQLRPHFRRTRKLFDRLRALNLEHTNLTHLSMGMSDSYGIAIDEGATIVRLGTVVFGPRPK
jgi:pyridoxal phosphate enzyme (YggS family)